MGKMKKTFYSIPSLELKPDNQSFYIYYFIYLYLIILNKPTDDTTKHCKDHPYDPKSHHNIFFTESNCFQVMMKRSDSKYFFSISKTFWKKLYDYGEKFEPKYRSTYHEYQECIRHHRDYSEGCTQRKCTQIAHIKCGWLYIEPKKWDKCSDDNKTKCGKNLKVMIIAYKCIQCIVE